MRVIPACIGQALAKDAARNASPVATPRRRHCTRGESARNRECAQPPRLSHQWHISGACLRFGLLPCSLCPTKDGPASQLGKVGSQHVRQTGSSKDKLSPPVGPEGDSY